MEENEEIRKDLVDIEALLAQLTVSTDELENLNNQVPVDLESLMFCDLNTAPYNMPNMLYPGIPSTDEEIAEFMNSPQVQELLDGSKFWESDISPDNYAIVEFGNEYINGEKVEYSLNIQPGDSLSYMQEIGTITQNGVEKKLCSIFNKGTVLAETNEPTTFMRLFPSKTTRHFIIHGYETNSDINIDGDSFNEITEELTKNTKLYDLIKDNLCYATLPIILSKHETKKEHADEGTFSPCKYKDNVGTSFFKNTLFNYFKILENISFDKDKLTALIKKDSAAAANEVLEQREQILKDIIEEYNKVFNYDKIGFIKNALYPDCIELKIDDPKKYALIYKDDDEEITHDDYYTYLICLLNADDRDNKKAQEYYKLLRSIILNRSLYFKHTKEYFIGFFNTLYMKLVNEKEKQGYQKISTDLYEETNILNIAKYLQNVAIQSVCNIDMLVEFYYSEQDRKKGHPYFNKFYRKFIDHTDKKGWDTLNMTYDEAMNPIKKKEGWDKKPEDVKDAILKKIQLGIGINTFKKLARLYYFINTSSIYTEKDFNDKPELQKSFTLKYTALELIQEEATQLQEFWKQTISEYAPIKKCIVEFENKVNEKVNENAIWPQPMDITIEGITYRHYLFKNEPVIEKKGSDEDSNNYDETVVPEKPEYKEPVQKKAPVEPSLDEITVTDIAYWKKYFKLATIITLPFLASGFDIPPTFTPIPLPAIYIAFTCVHIKSMDLLLVFGISIRGIYIDPVIICVNLSNQDASPLIPLKKWIKKIYEKAKAVLCIIEGIIPNLIHGMELKIIKDLEELERQNIQYQAMLDGLNSQVVDNAESIKKQMRFLTNPKADQRQCIFRTEDINLKNSEENGK